MNSRVLKTARLVLKPLILNNVEAFYETAREYDVLKMTATLPSPFTLQDAREKIEKFVAFHPDKGQAFGIFLEHKMIGNISIHYQQENIYELGYHMGKSWWGQGFTSEALMALVGWAYHQWGEVIRLEAGHYPDNPASGRVLEKAGFVKKDKMIEVYCKARGKTMPSIEYEQGYCDYLDAVKAQV